ncbi:MAG: hypothetical protein MUE52_04270 [Tabrizicola sp.]|jgi:hypothetical protein|nr:hypothetical protein [Tabrizicola sp.]
MSADMIAMAEEAWGAPLPDWIRALAIACGRSSQSKVAAQLDRSPAVVSTVLRKKYAGSYERIEERVRGILMDGRVECPALGQLPSHECQDWREKSKTFAPGNPLRTRMFRACQRCPVFKGEGEA